jgi:hypothetical protein
MWGQAGARGGGGCNKRFDAFTADKGDTKLSEVKQYWLEDVIWTLRLNCPFILTNVNRYKSVLSTCNFKMYTANKIKFTNLSK